MSLLTSLYPDSHRVAMGTALAEQHTLLPEVLRKQGYYTLGIINNIYLHSKYGYGRAFDYYDLDFRLDTPLGHRQRDIERCNRILESLQFRPEPPAGLQQVLKGQTAYVWEGNAEKLVCDFGGH